jgi:hypothetical protein
MRPSAGVLTAVYRKQWNSVDPWEGRMAQSVYKLWQGRFTEAWHQLAQEDQQRLLSQVMEALNKAGGKELVICSAAWSNERWPFFVVEEFRTWTRYSVTNRF